MSKNKKETEKYFAKGQVVFVQTKDGLKENRYDRDYYMEEYKSKLGTATENYVNYLCLVYVALYLDKCDITDIIIC